MMSSTFSFSAAPAELAERAHAPGKNSTHKARRASQSCVHAKRWRHPCSHSNGRKVGVTELESVTSCMSSKRSNQLSYTPIERAKSYDSRRRPRKQVGP